MEDPAPMQLYLGCIHRRFQGELDGKGKVNGVECDMESCLASCVQRYLRLCEPGACNKGTQGPTPETSKSNKKKKKAEKRH